MIQNNTIKELTGFIIILVLLILSACERDEKRDENVEKTELQNYLEKENITTKPNKSGLYYIEKSKGTGKQPVSGDVAVINFTGTLTDNTVFYTNNDSIAKANNIYRSRYNEITFSPIRIIVGMNIEGIDEGLKLMHEGGSAMLIIPSDLAYGAEGYSDIPPYSTLIYKISLLHVIKDPDAYEDSMINKYINDNKLSPEITAEGVYYEEIISGTGSKPEYGDLVSIKYTSRLIEGETFEQTQGDTLFSFMLWNNMTIEGLSEGVSKMKEGGKATLIIPYSLAFGTYGRYPIPPFSTIVYENLELVKIN